MGGHSRRLPSVGQLRLRSLHLTRFDRDYADTSDIPAFRGRSVDFTNARVWQAGLLRNIVAALYQRRSPPQMDLSWLMKRHNSAPGNHFFCNVDRFFPLEEVNNQQP